jgi:Luciferase-like monooxygenase
MTVRFSTRAPNADYLGFVASPEAIIAAAKKAEAVGFDAIFVNDHIIVGDDARSAPWTNVYYPFVSMSFIAAHTMRIGVGVSVLIMPHRNPIGTAKALATLDRMSGGRVIAGIGAGWNEAEFAALGVPRARRAHHRISTALAGMLGAGSGVVRDMSVDLSSDPAQALLLKPHAGPAVAAIAWIEENNAGMVERFLNCSECAGTRIGPTALQVFYSDFGETRRFSQLGLCPIEEPASCADLSGRDHSYTIVECVRNDNFGLPCLSSSLHSFVYYNAQKGYHNFPNISDWRPEVFMARLPRRRFCRRCGAEIATANLMDADPGVDREHFSLFLQCGQRRQLSPAEWRLFTPLYQRHGRIVPLAELATATRNAQSKLRGLIQRLRRSLARSRFLVVTHVAHGYELIVREEE